MRTSDVNDLIKRGDALEIVKRTNGDYVTAWSNIVALDAIDPESLRPRAHWIRKRSKFPGGELTVVECSLCECQQWNETNFCPICGAKMED